MKNSYSIFGAPSILSLTLGLRTNFSMISIWEHTHTESDASVIAKTSAELYEASEFSFRTITRRDFWLDFGSTV